MGPVESMEAGNVKNPQEVFGSIPDGSRVIIELVSGILKK